MSLRYISLAGSVRLTSLKRMALTCIDCVLRLSFCTARTSLMARRMWNSPPQ